IVRVDETGEEDPALQGGDTLALHRRGSPRRHAAVLDDDVGLAQAVASPGPRLAQAPASGPGAYRESLRRPSSTACSPSERRRGQRGRRGSPTPVRRRRTSAGSGHGPRNAIRTGAPGRSRLERALPVARRSPPSRAPSPANAPSNAVPSWAA